MFLFTVIGLVATVGAVAGWVNNKQVRSLQQEVKNLKKALKKDE